MTSLQDKTLGVLRSKFIADELIQAYLADKDPISPKVSSFLSCEHVVEDLHRQSLIYYKASAKYWTLHENQRPLDGTSEKDRSAREESNVHSCIVCKYCLHALIQLIAPVKLMRRK